MENFSPDFSRVNAQLASMAQPTGTGGNFTFKTEREIIDENLRNYRGLYDGDNTYYAEKEANSNQGDDGFGKFLYNNEVGIKEMLYNYARNFTVGSNNIWTKLLDDWYLERGADSREFVGNDNPYNKDIMNNIGFQMLMNKYKAWKSSGETESWKDPKGQWEVGSKGIYWHYSYDKNLALGGYKAFIPATEFIGSYHGTVAVNSAGSYSINLYNQTGWTSGSRLPFWTHNMLSKSGIYNGTSLYYDQNRSLPGYGGTFNQTYKFIVR